MPDALSERYRDLLQGSYDCVDRIVLNAYFRMGHSGGGFRAWWQKLEGSEDHLDNAHLMRLAGRFSRRLRAFAQGRGIPVIDCRRGEKKHQTAEEYLATQEAKPGLFLIMVAKAPAPVWEVSGKHHLEWKKPMPYVNHYSFHIWDTEWGHVTIKISGHPPFPAQVILNGHEFVACQARKAGLNFKKEENCFTHIPDAASLARVAETLSEERTIGRLSQVCERWIYTTCLCFALSLDEQQQSGFRYQYSVYQVESSRNLLFQVGGHMEEVFQALIDRTRAPLDFRKIKTILGYRKRPRYRKRKKSSSVWEVVVEKPTYDLTVLKAHCGKLTLKIYTKGERVLRIEVIVHNTEELDCGRSLEKFPEIVSRARAILQRFVETLSCVDACFVGDETLEQLPLPGQVGQTRVGGVDVNKPRLRYAAQAILALSLRPDGFTASEVAEQVRSRSGQTASQYGARCAIYDLKKFRAKQLVRRIGSTRRYEAIPEGLRTLTALLVLRDKVIKPLLAAAGQPPAPPRSQNPTPIDAHYQTLRLAMHDLLTELGVAA
jgi:hypothetical protein